MSKAVCVACQHKIDAHARTCPYCGADPKTGEKIDTEAILREVFQPRQVTTSESVLEFARHRQGIVVAGGVILVLVILTLLHQFVTMRNATAVASGPAVPLTEITDLSNQPADNQQLPMPELKFQYEGRPQTMRTFIVEPGAVTPPEVVAAQQAQAAAAAQAAAQKAGVAPRPGFPAPQPHPGAPLAQPQPGTRPAVPLPSAQSRTATVPRPR